MHMQLKFKNAHRTEVTGYCATSVPASLGGKRKGSGGKKKSDVSGLDMECRSRQMRLCRLRAVMGVGP